MALATHSSHRKLPSDFNKATSSATTLRVKATCSLKYLAVAQPGSDAFSRIFLVKKDQTRPILFTTVKLED